MKQWGTEQVIRVCRRLFIGSLVVFVAAAILLLTGKDRTAAETSAASGNGAPDRLSDALLMYPDLLEIGQPLGGFSVSDASGERVSLASGDGTYTLLLFWASWCKYCDEEFDQMQEYADVLAGYADVRLILVDKLDGEKETREKAAAFLEKKAVPVDGADRILVCYDEDTALCEALGVKIMPTLIGLDREGNVALVRTGPVGSPDRLAAYAAYLRDGPAKATETFLTTQMTNSLGGIYTNFRNDRTAIPSGHDILSESQGIMMEYAALRADRALFERTDLFLTEHMLLNGVLPGWALSEGALSQSNALVDDLRIVRALRLADREWGGYSDRIAQMAAEILKRNVFKGNLTDSYDYKLKRTEKKLTLCFADLEALRILSGTNVNNAAYVRLYENAVQTIQGGYLGDAFPFYARAYDYDTGEYLADEIHMAEAMKTILHLARDGIIKRETIAWIKERLKSGGIMARYTSDGEAAKGYAFESTAVYATAVMIAASLEDREMLTDALFRMERLRIDDPQNPMNGSFGDGSGESVYSYDQCMALLAYASMYE